MNHCLVFRKTVNNHLSKKTQFPSTLSWACTVHKVQGLHLTEGSVSFDLESQKSLNQGQMYVLLSRVTSINELYLTGMYNKAVLKAMNQQRESVRGLELKVVLSHRHKVQ